MQKVYIAWTGMERDGDMPHFEEIIAILSTPERAVSAIQAVIEQRNKKDLEGDFGMPGLRQVPTSEHLTLGEVWECEETGEQYWYSEQIVDEVDFS